MVNRVKGISALRTCAFLLVLSMNLAPAEVAPELREPDVLYFEGNLPNKITATVQNQATVYLNRDFQSVLAALYPGQTMELVGMCPEGFLIKSTYRNNSVLGWIRPVDLPAGIDTNLFAEAKKSQEHRDAVNVAISNKTVIQGMTQDEVKQSVGRPEQTTSHSDANGTVLTWTYTTYREDPQYTYVLNAYGQPSLVTTYVKIPIGQLIVDFVNGGVTAVTQRKVDPNSTTGVVSN